jgi:acyl-coenzyme A synthetase/AMP-(fatty) acid ligase
VAEVGEPDPVLDKVQIAFVVLRSGQDEQSGASSSPDCCADLLAPSGQPRRLVFLAELPHTSVGKIRMHQLSRVLDGQ